MTKRTLFKELKDEPTEETRAFLKQSCHQPDLQQYFDPLPPPQIRCALFESLRDTNKPKAYWPFSSCPPEPGVPLLPIQKWFIRRLAKQGSEATLDWDWKTTLSVPKGARRKAR